MTSTTQFLAVISADSLKKVVVYTKLMNSISALTLLTLVTNTMHFLYLLHNERHFDLHMQSF